FNSFKDYYPGIKAYKLRDKNTYFTGYFNGNTFFITDFIVEEKKDFKTIIACVLEIIKGTKTEIIRSYNNDTDLQINIFNPIFMKYSTPNSMIYYTKNEDLKNLIDGKTFYYTYQDSDENL